MRDNVYTDMIYNALYALVVFLRHPRLTVGNYIAARRFPYSRHDAAAWGLRYACDGADIRPALCRIFAYQMARAYGDDEDELVSSR